MTVVIQAKSVLRWLGKRYAGGSEVVRLRVAEYWQFGPDDL